MMLPSAPQALDAKREGEKIEEGKYLGFYTKSGREAESAMLWLS